MDLDVVPRDADLLRDVIGRLLQRMPVADGVEERHQHVKARPQGSPVLPEPLHDVGALLRHDDGGLRDDDEDEDGQHQGDDQGFGHGEAPFWLFAADPEGQTLDTRHAATLPSVERPVVAVLHAPNGAPQLRLADGAGREIVHQHRDLALERVHRVRAFLGPRPPEQVGSEDEERNDRNRREQQPLEPYGAGRPETHQGAHHKGADAEEEDVKPAGRENPPALGGPAPPPATATKHRLTSRQPPGRPEPTQVFKEIPDDAPHNPYARSCRPIRPALVARRIFSRPRLPLSAPAPGLALTSPA